MCIGDVVNQLRKNDVHDIGIQLPDTAICAIAEARVGGHSERRWKSILAKKKSINCVLKKAMTALLRVMVWSRTRSLSTSTAKTRGWTG